MAAGAELLAQKDGRRWRDVKSNGHLANDVGARRVHGEDEPRHALSGTYVTTEHPHRYPGPEPSPRAGLRTSPNAHRSLSRRPMKRPALFTTRTTAARRTTTRDASSISQARHDRQRGNDEGLPSWISRAEPAPAAVRQGNAQVITGCIGEIGMACEQDHVRCRSPTRMRLQGARAGCPSATYWC